MTSLASPRLVPTLILTATSVLAARASRGTETVQSGGTSVKVTEYQTVPYGPDPVEEASVWEPVGALDDPVVVFVHGGGWIGGGRDHLLHGESRNAFLVEGYVAVSLDYSLATKTRPSWPTAMSDVEAGLEWVQSAISSYGGDPSRVVVFGISAGANLAYLATEADPSLAQAVIGMSGPTDLGTLAADGAIGWLQGDAARFLGCVGRGPDQGWASCQESLEAEASPVDQLAQCPPPTFVANGLSEPVVPVAQAESYVTALQTAGCQATADYPPSDVHVGYWDDISAAVFAWLEDLPAFSEAAGALRTPWGTGDRPSPGAGPGHPQSGAPIVSGTGPPPWPPGPRRRPGQGPRGRAGRGPPPP